MREREREREERERERERERETPDLVLVEFLSLVQGFPRKFAYCESVLK